MHARHDGTTTAGPATGLAAHLTAARWRKLARLGRLGLVGLLVLLVAGVAADAGLAALFRRRLRDTAAAAARAAATAMNATAAATDLQVNAELGSTLVAAGFEDEAGDSRVRAFYLDGSGEHLGAVGGGTVPAAAHGIQVELSKVRPPLLAWPGQAPATPVSVSAGASLFSLANMVGQGKSPFILCGSQAVRVTDGVKSAVTDLLDTSTTPPSLNPDYRDTLFEVHGPQLDQDGGGCGRGSAWRGLADSSDADTCTRLPCAWDVFAGAQAGPASTQVVEQAGCNSNVYNYLPNGCLLVVPIAVNRGGGCPSLTANQLCVVTWGLFKIESSRSFEHTIRLLDGSQYIVVGGSGPSKALATCPICPRTVGLVQ